tara:strand:+ start:171 stop:797 length:627 start_codon:yes stop_codon:yes gene_type:complete
MSYEIILATNNNDKLSELTKILSKFSIKIHSLENFPQIGEIIEDGSSLKENALIKARTVFQQTKLPSLGDDTGLEVDALNGNPGIFSARYAGEECSYIDNVNKLLKEMKDVPLNLRTAKFSTVIAFVNKDMELISEGFVKGLITTSLKGVAGFGYDPVFYVPERKKTYSEMKMNEKNQISHRGKAIQNMIKLLRFRLPQIFHQMEDIA